jgi:hypothetical protein
MVAHVASVPLEEWLAPLLATSSGIVIVLRSALLRLRREAAGRRDPS